MSSQRTASRPAQQGARRADREQTHTAAAAAAQPLHLLADRWRTRAADLRPFAAAAAEAFETAARELESWTREYELEALTLEEAAAASGYSYSALEKMIRQRRLPNAGRPGAPRVRRADLPRKAPRRPTAHVAGDLADRVLAARAPR